MIVAQHLARSATTTTSKKRKTDSGLGFENDSGFLTKTFNEEKKEVDYEDVSLSQIQKKVCAKGEECFGCLWKFGKPADPTENPEMQKLWDTYVNNKLRGMDEDTLALLLEKTQKELFVEPFTKQGEHCPLWHRTLVKIHLKNHLRHQETEILDDLDSYRFVANFLLTRVGKRRKTAEAEDDGTIEENQDTIKLWKDLVKDKHNLWSKYNKEFKGI